MWKRRSFHARKPCQNRWTCPVISPSGCHTVLVYGRYRYTNNCVASLRQPSCLFLIAQLLLWCHIHACFAYYIQMHNISILTVIWWLHTPDSCFGSRGRCLSTVFFVVRELHRMQQTQMLRLIYEWLFFTCGQLLPSQSQLSAELSVVDILLLHHRLPALYLHISHS